MTDRLRAAAEAVLKTWTCGCGVHPTMGAALRELSAALAEPPVKDSLIAEEPVVWQCSECGGFHLLCPHGRLDIPLYAAPPRRQWQSLTEEERGCVINANFGVGVWQMAQAIEAALKEKNA